MPELPEVETVKNGLIDLLPKRAEISAVFKSKKQLRFKYPRNINSKLVGSKISELSRRAKYILFDVGEDYLLSHLGMTGTWRKQAGRPDKTHDHFALQINNKFWLVYNDPRRFGFVDLVTKSKFAQSKWIQHLGPEPLNGGFSAEYLYKSLKPKAAPIKTAIMNQEVVVGVGNIYASECLFLARIRPTKACQRVSQKNYEALYQSILKVLTLAIQAGGSTISDFKQAGGSEGYFQQSLNVYGRAGLPCVVCKSAIKQITQSGRSSFYCPKCQK